MTKEFCDLLHLFRCAVHGEEAEPISSDAESVLKLAERQGVWTVVFPVVKKLYEKDSSILSAEKIAKYDRRFINNISIELRRKIAVRSMLGMLEKEGIKCCILKGEILAELYAVPETRISSDTDILLENPDLEEKVCDIMEKHGFDVMARPSTSNHAMCRSAATGLVEFHLTMHDELMEDVWFNKLNEKNEPTRRHVSTDGGEITTLGYTDGAVFVALHFIKHFLSAGVGIRQLMDVLLYIRQYRNEIDQKRFNQIMKDLKYDRFLKTCAKIGEKFLGIKAEEIFEFCEDKGFSPDEDLICAVLSDIEDGGLFGHDDEKREEFYKLYTEARFARFKDGSYDEYMKNWGHVPVLKRLFPSYRAMQAEYRILKKHPSLLPFMYAHRIGKKMFGITKGDVKIKPYKTMGKDRERLEMIKKLDMI